MRIDHQFAVAAPIERVWEVMSDPRRCVTSLPGATLDTLDGEAFTGRIAVKLGPMSLTYKGEGKLAQEPTQRRIVIEGQGAEQRGAGTAVATITVQLEAAAADRTTAAVGIDLDLAGKPAQFGRGILAEVVARLAAQFVQRLEQQLLAEDAGTGAASLTQGDTTGADGGDAVDLLDLGRAMLVRRAAPVVGALAAAAVVVLLVRAVRRGRGD